MSIKEHEEAILRESYNRDAWDEMRTTEHTGLFSNPDIIDLAGDPLDWPLEERPLAYIASYYTANPAQGVANAVDAYKALLEVGYLPVVPHVNILLDMLAPNTPDHWYSYDRAILARCDFMYVCPDYLTAHSAGVLNEIGFATKHGIPILYDIVPAVDRYR